MITIPQAGAIVFRTAGGVQRVLLVRAKHDPSQWIFPKGHLEPGESHSAAALREAFEEAGVTGIALGLVGATTFRSGDEQVAVEYSLVRMVTETASPEAREKIWLSPVDALKALAFEDAQGLLRTAMAELDARVHDDDARFDEFMLREHAHVAESLLANEEGGEKRVAFFVTLCGAVGTGLGFILSRGGFGLPERWLVTLTLVVLLMLGYVTFLRVIVRNAASDRYKNQLARIRVYFLSGENDSRIRHLPFHPFFVTQRNRDKTKKTNGTQWSFLGKGGWAETVALVEVLLGGALVAFLVWAVIAQTTAWAVFIATALGAIAAPLLWYAMFRRADDVYESERKDQRDGSVPLRGGGGPFPN